MFTLFHRVYRKCRAWGNREEWVIHLLRLSKQSKGEDRKGLILVQIDGLAYAEFVKALEKGYMPFLRYLKKNEHYPLWELYPGLPSNTPSFQGEFFYGVRQCVPAFQFYDRRAGKKMTMYECDSSKKIEEKLQEQDEGLLKGGSCYANIFTGGAKESNYCASSSDWRYFWKLVNPYPFFVTLLLMPVSIFRALTLALMEVVLAFYDFLRGALKGYDVIEEVKFILTRVMVIILMREAITAHGRMDIARGVPVIHMNYFGYDEQSHRRGPGTRFAYWSLGGIDASIRRIWRAAAQSKRCHYDLWIYSDHGQEYVTSFPLKFGKSLDAAVRELYLELTQANASDDEKKKASDSVIVTAMGPVAHIYFLNRTEETIKEQMAKILIQRFSIPIIMQPGQENQKPVGYCARGRFVLPAEAEKIIPADHPFKEQMKEDLISLCAHPDTGDLMMISGCEEAEAMTFSMERGAHAGMGRHETRAFALLPSDAPMEKAPNEFLRIADLRNAALVFLGKKKKAKPKRRHDLEPGKKVLRILTYNVHSCVGLDGKFSHQRIARVIARHNPDVIALQELDAGRRLKKHDHQAERIACDLEMSFHYHAVYGSEDESFGNALLSRFPIKLVRAGHLPRYGQQGFFEPRGLLWVEVDFEGVPIQVLTTHLSLWAPERKAQIQAMFSDEWVHHPRLKNQNVILCGDFNTSPDSVLYQTITQYFSDVTQHSAARPMGTWTSRFPIRRLDYIFYKGNVQVADVIVTQTALERMASDHLPLTADLIIAG